MTSVLLLFLLAESDPLGELLRVDQFTQHCTNISNMITKYVNVVTILVDETILSIL